MKKEPTVRDCEIKCVAIPKQNKDFAEFCLGIPENAEIIADVFNDANIYYKCQLPPNINGGRHFYLVKISAAGHNMSFRENTNQIAVFIKSFAEDNKRCFLYELKKIDQAKNSPT